MERAEILKKIEQIRKSRVVAYVTSDRPGPINARVATDIIPVLNAQLRAIGKVPKIDLVLYTSGGDTLVPWRAVSMIREYCDEFSVLVPYKAHSAGTMLCLGGDQIVMTDMAELTPIDPSTANTFNPADPQNPQNKVPISVEEVMSFISLARDQVGIKKEEELTKIFNKFVDSTPSIHPLALGNVNRAYKLIRILAGRLLDSHQTPLPVEQKTAVVNALTSDLPSHQYIIGRREARDQIGIKTVQYADNDLSTLLISLYESYREEAGMGIPWNPELELGEHRSSAKKDYAIAFIESVDSAKKFRYSIEMKRLKQMVSQPGPNGPVMVQQEQVTWRNVGNLGWE